MATKAKTESRTKEGMSNLGSLLYKTITVAALIAFTALLIDYLGYKDWKTWTEMRTQWNFSTEFSGKLLEVNYTSPSKATLSPLTIVLGFAFILVLYPVQFWAFHKYTPNKVEAGQ